MVQAENETGPCEASHTYHNVLGYKNGKGTT